MARKLSIDRWQRHSTLFSFINVRKSYLTQHVKQLRGCGTVVARPLCMRKVRGSTPRISIAFVSERSKELDSSSSVFALVGSNPTECIFLVLWTTNLLDVFDASFCFSGHQFDRCNYLDISLLGHLVDHQSQSFVSI